MKLYEALAHALEREGVTDCFALLGDANMHWAGVQAETGVNFIYTRHEHAAVAGAVAYARTSGKVGFASVTCGPGLTQVLTILPIAVRARIPVVVFAGEAPMNKPWYNQGIDHAPFIEACGAIYMSLQDMNTVLSEVHRAFAIAKEKRIPVVFGIPFDLQKQHYTGGVDQLTSIELYSEQPSIMPDLHSLAEAVAMIDAAERPVVLAGLGAVAADAKDACVELAQKAGALLATTLPAKGYFRDQDYALGIAGGYASDAAKAIFKDADLVIGIGTRLATHAFHGGKLTPNARVIHLDLSPQSIVQGREAAQCMVKGDARLGAAALADMVKVKAGWRSDEMKISSIKAQLIPDQTETPDGLLHPMSVVKSLSEVLKPDCHLISTSGHSAYYVAQMAKHPQERFTVIRDFGAIGNGTSWALGTATAHPDRPIVLIDGDGSVLMHIQELETMARHGMKVLIIVMNDGAYGSEIHKLRPEGISDEGAVFGRPNFEGISKGFGFDAITVIDVSQFDAAFEAFQSGDKPALWDVHISDQVASPMMPSLTQGVSL